MNKTIQKLVKRIILILGEWAFHYIDEDKNKKLSLDELLNLPVKAKRDWTKARKKMCKALKIEEPTK